MHTAAHMHTHIPHTPHIHTHYTYTYITHAHTNTTYHVHIHNTACTHIHSYMCTTCTQTYMLHYVHTHVAYTCTYHMHIHHVLHTLRLAHLHTLFPKYGIFSPCLFFSLGSFAVYMISTGMQKNHLREKITSR